MKKFCSLIASLLIRLIPIRTPSQKQNKVIILKIVFQELLLVVLIGIEILKTPILNDKLNEVGLVASFYALSGIRIISSLIFLILKLQVLYAFQIILIVFYEILFSQKTLNIFFPILSFLLEILMTIVYALGQQVRNNNISFMGRLNIAPYIFRLVISFFIAFLSIFVKQQTFLMSILFLLFIKIALIEKQKKTNLFLKSALIRLEVINLVILMLGLSQRYLQFSYLYFISLSAVILLLYLIHLPFIKTSSKVIYEIGVKLADESRPQECTSDEALQYFLTLNYWLTSNNQTQLLNFLFFHRKICKNAGCPMWFKNDSNFEQNKYPLQMLKKMVSLHIQRTIFSLKKQSQELNKFTVYFLSPSSKVYRFIKECTFYGRRELYRLENQEKVKDESNLAIQASYKENNEDVEKKLKEMLRLRELLYLLLLKKGIRESCIVNIGQKIIDLNKKLIQKSKNQELISYTNNFKLNQFFLEFLPDETMNLEMNGPELILETGSKEFISILLGAQGERFGKVLNVNQQAVKWTYLPKDVLLKITINDLVPGEFNDKHVKAIDTKYSKVTTFDSYNDLPQTIFVFNALGFIVPGLARIYRLTNQFGRYWNVIYEPNYLLDAIMIMTFEGKMIGFNEMATYYGMKKDMLGKYISKSIAQFLLNSCNSKYIDDFEQQLFENYETTFNENTVIQKVETMERMCKYIIIKFVNRDKVCMTMKNIEDKKQIIQQNYFIYETKGKISMVYQLNPEQETDYLQDRQNITNQTHYPLLNINKKAKIETQEIDQMILINNKIDYKRNIKLNEQQEVQIPTRPLRKYNKKYEHISEQFYKAGFEKREQQSSCWRMKWCLTFSGSTLIIAIVLILITTVLDLTNIFRQEKELEIFLLFNKQFLSYTHLGMLPVNTIHNTQFDVKGEIEKLSRQIQNRWKLIQSKEPNTNALLNIMIPQYQYNRQYAGLLQQKQEQFLIVIKSFLANDGNKDQDIYKIANYLLLAIFPGYRALVENVDTFYREKEAAWIYTAILIRLGSFILLIIAASIAVIFYKINQSNKMEILQVISRIQDSTLIQQLAKIYYLKKQAESFQQFVPPKLQKKDVKNQRANHQKQQIAESLQKHFENIEIAQKRPKQIIFSENLCKIICILGIVLILIPIYIYQFHQYFEGVEQYKIVKSFLKNNYQMVACTYPLWVGNNFVNKFDSEQLEDLQSRILECDGNIQQLYSLGVQGEIFDTSFIQFYQKLMESNVCELLQRKNCQEDFNGALKNGIKQLFAFLNRKFEEINQAQKYFSSLRGIQILQSSQIQDIINANEFYLPFAINEIQSSLKASMTKFYNSHIIINGIIAITQLVILIGIGIWTYIQVNKIIKHTLILEGTINILPFEAINQIAFFQTMISKEVEKS